MTDRRRPLEEACPSPFCIGVIRRTWWTDVVSGEPTPPGQVAVCCATCSRVIRLEPAPADWPAQPAEVPPDAEVAAQLRRGLEYTRAELPARLAAVEPPVPDGRETWCRRCGVSITQATGLWDWARTAGVGLVCSRCRMLVDVLSQP